MLLRERGFLSTQLTFGYDGLGRRVQRQDSGGAAQLVWDRDNVLRETSGGSLLAEYTLRPSRHGVTLSQRRSGASQYYHLDGLGSAAQLTDSAQAVTDRYWYEAYGALRSSQGTSVNPFRYVGGLGYYFDPDTANYLLRARHYSPSQARFLSRDPLAFAAPSRDGRWGRAALLGAGLLNLYAYAGGRPVVGVDPSGLQTVLAPPAPGPLVNGFVPLPAPLPPPTLPVTTPTLAPYLWAAAGTVAIEVAAWTGVVIIVCGVSDLAFCTGDEAKCAARVLPEAAGCAAIACVPKQYRRPQAANQWKCTELYLMRFDTECEAAVIACLLSCGATRADPPLSCTPNPCGKFCCTDESTCHDKMGCQPIAGGCLANVLCPITQCKCERISEPGEPVVCACNERTS